MINPCHSLRAILPLLLLAGTHDFAQAADAALAVRVRDALTGAPLPAHLAMHSEAGVNAHSHTADRTGRATLLVPPGRITLRAELPGFRPLETFFTPEAGQLLPVTLWLDPVEPVDSLPAPRRDAALAAGRGMIYGFIWDDAQGRPVAGAAVRLARHSEPVRSGADGFFALEYSALPPGQDDLPDEAELIIERAGYQRHHVSGLLLHAAAVRLNIDLRAGRGEFREDQSHKMKRSAQEQANAQLAPHPPEPELAAAPPAMTPQLQGLAPPASIRVGTTCTCSTCSGVSVMSLETYVAGGLDNEWISSWNAHSLRAGSIAFRSYGAYYANNPINGTYDICSTTCCQVYGSATVAATVAAAGATAGFMLQRTGTAFRSEYSAENNAWDDLADGLNCSNANLSCGDGSAGSPGTANWPCLADAVCLGRGCFGHGRGECQWGTQRNATTGGRFWNWINNFYYNNLGTGTGNRTAYLTTPVTLSTAAPSPAINAAGATFTINATVINSAGLSHSQVMIGASIYSAASGSISNPANDTKVNLPAGTNNVTRPFTIPAGTPAGVYDLIVSLYYDVDGNNSITALDQSLQLATYPAAVRVAQLPPPIPDGDAVPGTAMKAGKNGVALRLTWSGCAGAARTNIYYGPLSAVSTYGYSGSQCNIGLSGVYDWTAPAGSLFYHLVNDNGAAIESSWGLNSTGAEAGGAAASGRCGNTLKATNGTCS